VTTCYFVSDLHGHVRRYTKLFEAILSDPPDAVFIGGDLLPHGLVSKSHPAIPRADFVNDFLVAEFARLQKVLQDAYPRIFVILGNDDGRWPEEAFREASSRGTWQYIPNDKVRWREFLVYGYAYVPPTPFQLKDWDRYDVSRFVDPGSVSPEDGFYSVPVPENVKRYATIQNDLERLAGLESVEHALFLFHTPPYQSNLDRLSGHPGTIDHVPTDLHGGSIAVKRFIETRQPLITLHGHIHESPRITGSWKDRIGRTYAFSAAHDGPELALVRFSPEDPGSATRELLHV
jgi:Icc-related predicted phosphoesterase